MKETRTVKKMLRKISISHHYPQLIALLSFLVTFFLIRLVAHFSKSPLSDHLTEGVIMVLGASYAIVSFSYVEKIRRPAAFIWGFGAALTIDELVTYYWPKQGRNTVDAAIIVVVLLAVSLIVSEIHERPPEKMLKNRLTKKK